MEKLENITRHLNEEIEKEKNVWKDAPNTKTMTQQIYVSSVSSPTKKQSTS